MHRNASIDHPSPCAWLYVIAASKPEQSHNLVKLNDVLLLLLGLGSRSSLLVSSDLGGVLLSGVSGSGSGLGDGGSSGNGSLNVSIDQRWFERER
jgi:hypothetical protein